MKYAGFWRRWAAQVIDGVIIAAAASVITLIFPQDSSYSVLGSSVIIIGAVGYLVYFVGSRGQTLGKMVMNIKVVGENGKVIGYGRAALREIVGKFLSGLILDLGYLWMIWDPKKQTWHDKITKTFVIKV